MDTGKLSQALTADGFSCRTQLAAGRTGREGVHLAQLLAELTGGDVALAQKSAGAGIAPADR